METSEDKITIYDSEAIRKKIYTIHNLQVMLDSDLAAFYGVETKQLNRAVKRNIERFPDEFMFQLDDNAWESLRRQIGTLNNDSLRYQIGTSKSGRGGRRFLPYEFHGSHTLEKIVSYFNN
jgi:hypothetical protein